MSTVGLDQVQAARDLLTRAHANILGAQAILELNNDLELNPLYPHFNKYNVDKDLDSALRCVLDALYSLTPEAP